MTHFRRTFNCCQFVQIAKLFVQYLVTYNNENFLNSTTCQTGHTVVANQGLVILHCIEIFFLEKTVEDRNV